MHMCKNSCTISKITSFLVIIGGINWGLVGVGMLLGTMDLNIIKMLLGGISWLEAIIYVLVGIASVMMIFGCKCKTCATACQSCGIGSKGGMEGNNKMM